MPLQRPSIFGSVITCELCYSAAHVSVPSRFVSSIPHIHHRPNCASAASAFAIRNNIPASIQFQFRTLAYDSWCPWKANHLESKEMGGYGCHPSFKVESQQQKEKEPKVDFITLCFLRGVLACCRVASQTLICPLKPSSSSPSQTSQGCSLNITNIRSQYTVFLLCGEIKETLNIFQSN